MVFIKRFLIIVSSVMFIFTLVGFFLPQVQRVERSVNILAPVDTVYPYLVNPKLFGEWSPRWQMDPNIQVQYIGPEMGKGAGMTWQSEDQRVGKGMWIVVDTVKNKSASVEMDFNQQGRSRSFFRLEAKGEYTKTTWGFDTDSGMNPLMRWVGLLIDKLVGAEYKKGLGTLKTLIEKSK